MRCIKVKRSSMVLYKSVIKMLIEGLTPLFKDWESTMTVWWNLSSPLTPTSKKLWSARKIPGNFHEKDILCMKESDLHGWPVHTERTLTQELLALERLCPALAAEIQLCKGSAALPMRGSVLPDMWSPRQTLVSMGWRANRASTYMWWLRKTLLGNTVGQARSWICGWDHKCLYLHFQDIVLRPLWVLCCTVCSFTYIFKRKRWKHNGNRGLDF